MEILTSVRRLYISFKSLVNDFVYSFGRAALLLLVELYNHTIPVRERRRIRVNLTIRLLISAPSTPSDQRQPVLAFVTLNGWEERNVEQRVGGGGDKVTDYERCRRGSIHGKYFRGFCWLHSDFLACWHAEALSSNKPRSRNSKSSLSVTDTKYGQILG